MPLRPAGESTGRIATWAFDSTKPGTLKSERHSSDQLAMPTDPIIIIIGGSLFDWLFW